MKFAALAFVALIAFVATARPGGPGGPGFPGGGPGGGFPVPGGPGADPCDADYSGNYQYGGPVTIQFREAGGGRVNVWVTNQGQTWTTWGTCNNSGFSFSFGRDYYHQGQFRFKHFGPFSILQGLDGWEYSGNRPYQQFTLNLN